MSTFLIERRETTFTRKQWNGDVTSHPGVVWIHALLSEDGGLDITESWTYDDDQRSDPQDVMVTLKRESLIKLKDVIDRILNGDGPPLPSEMDERLDTYNDRP